MKRLIITLGLAAAVLTGCSSDEEIQQELEAKQKADIKDGGHALIYAEPVMDARNNEGEYEVAYRKAGRTEYRRISGEAITERILRDPAQKPFIIRDEDGDWIIYRQPSFIYGTEDIEDVEVKDKQVIK